MNVDFQNFLTAFLNQCWKTSFKTFVSKKCGFKAISDANLYIL